MVTRENSILLMLDQNEEEIGIPVWCAQELLQGARNAIEWKQLSSFLETREIVLPSNTTTFYSSAARIYYEARRKGFTVRSSIDCCIAQLCIENQATLLHKDKDFNNMQKVRSILKFV